MDNSSSFPYFGAQKSDHFVSNSLHIIGVGFDGSASFRKGAANGPDTIRNVSSELETYSPDLDMDLTEISPYYDLGNVQFDHDNSANKTCENIHMGVDQLLSSINIKDEQIRILALGGDHSIAYPFIKHYLQTYPYLLLIHLDAHADLRDGYEGVHFSHASIMRRCLDQFGPHHELLQYGIRSGTREEFTWMRQNKTLYTNFEKFIIWLQELPRDQPIYLTLDLDYFDPSLLPGTGTPEAGGQTFNSFMEILNSLGDKQLIGADVVELAPNIDPTGNSALFAAKVVREIILTFHGQTMGRCLYARD